MTHEGGPKPSHIVELMLSLDVRLVQILHTPSPHPFPFIDNIPVSYTHLTLPTKA